MEQAPQSNKVLIIGAGLGGLVLAQILKKNGVPFEIFERDEGLASRKQGWAVALLEYVCCFPNPKTPMGLRILTEADVGTDASRR
jgi:cation diffusion facilitator CzcD-associated flavoprotein CzcO